MAVMSEAATARMHQTTFAWIVVGERNTSTITTIDTITHRVASSHPMPRRLLVTGSRTPPPWLGPASPIDRAGVVPLPAQAPPARGGAVARGGQRAARGH